MTSAAEKVCLSIAGLDPSGGAGMLADIKTFQRFNCYGAAAVTSITFQNTVGVFGARHVSGKDLNAQLQPIFDDIEVAACKTGMLPTAETIEITASILNEHNVKLLVVDPVVRSTSGFDLIDDEALRMLVARLFPLAALVTPNIPEAERITQIRIEKVSDIHAAAKKMIEMGAANVLIKGGHAIAEDDPASSIDRLYSDSGVREFIAGRISTTATHGTGCVLSAAITSNLALGYGIEDAISIAKEYLSEAIRTAPMFGRGHSPVNI